jgi:rod shape-determining protein MreC
MAPPRNRRLGFSRRVQMSLFLSYVVAVICLVIGVGLLIVGRLDPSGYHMLRTSVLDLTAPVTGAGRQVVVGIERNLDAVSGYIDAGGQNQALKTELDNARRQLVRQQGLAQENARLRRTLRLVDTSPATVAVARVVGSSLTAPRRYAVLSAGTADGVAVGEPVISSDGLIGRIVEAGRGAARILLITDAESAIPVRMSIANRPAIATGRGDGTLALRALVGGARPFKPGDVAFTSGTGGIFAPGVPVAVVVSGDADSAIARPLADPALLDFAVVQKIYQEDVPSASASEPTARR